VDEKTFIAIKGARRCCMSEKVGRTGRDGAVWEIDMGEICRKWRGRFDLVGYSYHDRG
jgi:hypothetical protein